jgi:DNA-binding FadR family transcriptional regulator
MKKPKKTKSGSLSDRSADELGRRIVSGRYKEGEVLPSDRDLQEDLGVSRTALREGLKTLSAKGLVASRQNVGTKVLSPKNWSKFDRAVLRWHAEAAASQPFIQGLFEVRFIVEPAAAEFAASRATDEDIELIGEAVKQMSASVRDDESLILADIAFHRAVLEASHSFFLGSFGELIESALRTSFRLTWERQEPPRIVSIDRHGLVYQAIRDRAPARARVVAQELISSSAAIGGFEIDRGAARSAVARPAPPARTSAGGSTKQRVGSGEAKPRAVKTARGRRP